MPIKIGGLARCSSVDWPDQLVATVFLQGCPWRCPYCHNKDLLPATSGALLDWDGVRDFLLSRRGLLDGVTFSGGEPTAQDAVIDAVREVREMGFAVGLHTGGAYPEIFKALLPDLAWVGFDVKAPFADYARITMDPKSGETTLASLRLLIESGVPFEVRTTVHPALIDDQDMERIVEELAALGVAPPKIQPFREPPQ